MTVSACSLNRVAALAALIAFVTGPAQAAENIGPWEIEAIYKDDIFDRCTINRSVQDDIDVRFVRTAHDLRLELSSPHWQLERGENYPVKMTIGSHSFDAKVAAEPNAVSLDIDDKTFESRLRNAGVLNIVAAGATIRVPLDKSTVAFDRLQDCIEKNRNTAAANVFCGSATSAVVAGVREGKGAECGQDADAAAEKNRGEDAKPIEDVKPLIPIKSRKLRSRPLPAFFADLFASQRR